MVNIDVYYKAMVSHHKSLRQAKSSRQISDILKQIFYYNMTRTVEQFLRHQLGICSFSLMITDCDVH